MERPREMPDDPIAPSGAMEGGGAYNRHVSLPARGGAFAVPHLEDAARAVRLANTSDPIVLADYGSSQGRNSFAPMRVAIAALRERVGAERPILVYHEDLPANDFNALFAALASDPQRYALDQPNVFPCAIGRSFYEQVLPSNHVHLGWCCYAAMWISRIPAQIEGHFYALAATGAARQAFLEQGAHDWERFLSLRAAELGPGGRLIVVVPGANDDGTSAFRDIMDHANETLAEMVKGGAIKTSERGRMALGVWPRRSVRRSQRTALRDEYVSRSSMGRFRAGRRQGCIGDETRAVLPRHLRADAGGRA
jgi:SAM dependent carboxyl methyltransferase